MQIDKPEHRAAAEAADQLHQAAVAASRRTFLKAAAGGAALTAGAALVGVPAAGALTSSSTRTQATLPSTRDLILPAIAREKAVVDAYDKAAAKLQDQDYKDTALLFKGHHDDHATLLAENILVLTPDELAAIEPDPTLEADLTSGIDGASDDNGVIAVLGNVEEQLAATYYLDLATLVAPADAKNVALIQPVDGMHAVVWEQAQGLTPDQFLISFQTDTDAFT